MFKNFLLTAMRNMARYRIYTVINVLGLAVGLAACIMILLFVNHELSYDKWIPENDRVWRAEATFYDDSGSVRSAAESIPAVASKIFGEQLADIELYSRLLPNQIALAWDGQAFEQGVTHADTDVFELMGIHLIEGDPATALSQPDALILTESDAKRIFGDASPMGQLVKVDGEHLLRITGIMPDWPEASDISVHGLAPVSSVILNHMPWVREEWGSYGGPTYIRTRTAEDKTRVEEEMNALALRVGPSQSFADFKKETGKPEAEFFLTAAVDAHLKSDTRWGAGRGSEAGLIAAGAIAALILVIAVINAANLGTMLAMKRVREVAIRKALGAKGVHLMLQILVESIALTFISMVIGLAIAEALLPTFGDLMLRNLTSAPIYEGSTLALILLGTVLVGSLCGLYPALVATRFRPVDHISGIMPKSGKRFSGALVVMQFAATIGLLTTCLVVFMQAEYAKSQDRGYNSAQLVALSGVERPVILARQEAFRSALMRIEGVEAVAASHGVPGHAYNNRNGVRADNGTETVLRRFAMSEELLPMLEPRLLAGRLFDKNRPTDSVTQPNRGASGSVILNDLAVRELGFATPEEAIGREIRTWGDFRSTIIGVVENLRTRSAKQEPSATYYWVGPHEYRHILVRVDEKDMANTLAEIERSWKSFFPDLPIRQQFVDDAYAEYYEGERRQGWLLLFSAIVMVIIAVMGLYGMAALATERRAREISIRKVLGAENRTIVKLLLWQFSTPILVANLIAWPVAWWSLSGWLDGFVDRIGLSPIPFVVAGAAVLFVAWLTIISHTMKVARANPIKALRYE